MSYQYENANFNMLVTREHFFKNKQYQLFTFSDELIMTEDLNKQPKYVYKINLTTTIRWVLSKGKLTGFELQYQNGFKIFTANGDKLHILKESLAGKVFFMNIREFHTLGPSLGKGMAGEVVRSDSYGEKFAVKKILKQKVISEQGGIAQFIHELQIMSVMQHQNIVKLKEVYTDENHYYIAMEYIEGRTLSQELSNSSGLSVAETIAIMKQLFEAVSFIHNKGIMHRDLNPMNIMRESSGNVKIIDFGLSRKVNYTQIIFPTSGTPGYMAPEVINFQKQYDEKADIYSLGCIMFRLYEFAQIRLTGEHLFKATSKLSVYQVNREGTYELKKSLQHPEYNTSKMDQLFILIQYMLEPDPMNRMNIKACQTVLQEIDNNNQQIERLIKKIIIRKQLTFSTDEVIQRSFDKDSVKERNSARHKSKQSIDTKRSTDEMSVKTIKQKQVNVLHSNNPFKQK